MCVPLSSSRCADVLDEKWTAYAQSKSANVLFAKGLAKHHDGLRAFSMTPGVNPSGPPWRFRAGPFAR